MFVTQGCRTNSAFGALFSHHDCGCLWIVQPFILGFAWAGTVVMPPGRYCYVCKRSCLVAALSRSGDDAVISDGVYHPYCLAGNSIVDGSGPLIKAISSGDMTYPIWRGLIPFR